jgi:hypothetical protein
MTYEETLDRMPVDTVGSVAALANQAHLKTLKICLVAAVAVAVLMAAAAAFAFSRPPQTAIIRVDSVRGAELVRMPASTLSDIRTADVQNALWNWTLWRYRVLKGDAMENLELSRIYMSSEVAGRYRNVDTKRVAEVLAGARPEQTADIRMISIPPLKRATHGIRTVLNGHAVIALVTRENLQLAADEDTTKRIWRVDLEFYVDPSGAAKRAQDGFFRYQIVDPLGIVLTNYWETEKPGEAGATN